MTSPTPNPNQSATVVRLSELLSEAQRPTDWLVTGILPMSELLLLFGDQHTGKTYAALDLGRAVATGQPWHGHPVTAARPVLYVPSEGRRGIGRRVLASLAHHAGGTSADAVPFMLYDEPLDLTAQDGGASLRTLAATIRAEAVGLLVVDVFGDFTAGVEENGRDFGHALTRLRTIGQSLGCAVVAVHHSGKDASRGARGHSSVAGAADLIVRVTHTPLLGPDGTPLATAVRLENTKNRNEDAWASITLDLRKPDGAPAPLVVGLWAGGTNGDAARAATIGLVVGVAELLAGGPPTRRQLADHLDLPLETVRDRATEAVEAGLLTQETHANKTIRYGLTRECLINGVTG